MNPANRLSEVFLDRPGLVVLLLNMCIILCIHNALFFQMFKICVKRGKYSDSTDVRMLRDVSVKRLISNTCVFL